MSLTGHSSTFFVLATTFSLLLTLYALYVEIRHEENSQYKPLCDLAERISCSKAFTSRYGKGFGIFSNDSPLNIANPIYGLFFYTSQLLLYSISGSVFAHSLLLLSSITSNAMSVYLAYIQYRMNNLCVVCAAIYCTNAVALIASIYRWRLAKKLKYKKQ